jgi:antitoxin component YwqK of YwqJK toxin-antitoxin module
MRGKLGKIILMTACLAFFCTYFVAAQSMKEVYDTGGNVTERQYYREDGSLEQVIKYDEYGHKIGEAYYGMGGKLKETADGWAAMRWKYKDGKIIGEGYYAADGRLKEVKQYNELGDLVAKKYVGGGSIDPSEEYNSVPPLSGETTSYYDKYGRLEGSTSVSYDPAWFPEVWLLEDEYGD